MNTFSIDFINNVEDPDRSGVCPEWVKTERLYNCDNFYHALHEKKFDLFRRLFKKPVKQ